MTTVRPTPTPPESALASLAESLIQVSTPAEMAALALAEARRRSASPQGCAAYVDRGQTGLAWLGLAGGEQPSGQEREPAAALEAPPALLDWFWAQGRPVVSNTPDLELPGLAAAGGQGRLTRLLSLPAVSRGRVLGLVVVANAPRAYTSADQQALEPVARLYGLALERAGAADQALAARLASLEEANRSLGLEMAKLLRAAREAEHLFQAAPEFMAVIGLDGLVRRFNPAYARLFGRSREELLRTPLTELVHPEERELLAAALAQVGRGEQVLEVELRARHKDGSYVWTCWSGLRTADPGLLYLVGRNISRRKGYERALQDSEELFRSIFDQSPLGAALLSLELVFLRVNPELCHLLGYPARELIGRSFEEVTHAQELPADRQNIERLLTGEVDHYAREKRYLRQDGMPIWGRVSVRLVRDAQGMAQYFLSTIEDITEQKRAEQERRLTLARQEALLALQRMVEAPSQEICDFTLAEAVRLTGSELGYLFLLSEDQRTFTVHAWSPRVEELCAVPGKPRQFPLAQAGLWAEAVRQGRPVITNDYAAPSPHKKGLPKGHPPLVRHLGVPVFEGQRVVAVIGVANKPEGYDQGDVGLLELLTEGMWGVLQRGRAQRALKESEALFRQMFENNRSVKLVVDPANGAIVRANQAACAFYGYGLAELSRMSITDLNLLPPAQVEAAMQRAVGQSQGCFLFQHRLADGQVRQVEVYSGPIVLEGRGLLYSIIHDVTDRLRAEQALRDSQERYRDLVEGTDDLVVQVDERGRFTFVNHMAAEIFGLEPADCLGRSLFDFIHPDEREELREAFAAWLVEKPQSITLDCRQQSLDGRVHHMLWAANPHYNPAGDLVLINGIARDISERKLAEEALRLSEERFRLAFEDSPVGMALVGLQGRFLEANASLCAMLGYSPEEMKAFTFGQVTHPDYLAAGMEGFRRLLAGEISMFSAEKRYLRRDGSPVWALMTTAPMRNAQGEPLYLISQVLDISERKLAEEALRESEEKFAKAFQAGPVFMIITDLADGRTLEVNEAFAQALGYGREEMLGRTTQEMDIWADNGLRTAVLEAVRNQGKVRDLEAQARTRAGGLYTCLVSAERIQVGGRECVLGVALDITARKALEEQARLAQKRESLALMAGGVAHDFNNLLQSVLGNADLALLDIPPASATAEHLREVQHAAQRAAELAHKMLAYSGHTPYVPRPLDLARLVRDQLPLLRSSLPSWIELHYDLPLGLPSVAGDAAQLQQALRNLFTNAAEALGEQPGLIFISAGCMLCDRELLASTYLDQGLAAGEYVFLRVEDSGPGMDPDTASKAFDPFFSTKFAGRGLGLAVALGVIRAHQGAVKIEPRPGGGTRVTLFLPTGGLAQAQGQPQTAAEPAPASARPRLLLVDDEDSVRMVARRMLEKQGLEILEAASGRQALETLGEHAGEIQAVLVDLNMPGMSGEALISKMHELDPQARIVVSSSLEQTLAQAQLSSCPTAGFIQKPYRMATLVELMRRVLGLGVKPSGLG